MIEGPPEPPEHEHPPETPSAEIPPPERKPFWGYSDLALFIGLLIASGVISLGVVGAIVSIFHLSGRDRELAALAIQSLLYLLAFTSLAMLFRVEYQRPFWRSMGWIAFSLPPAIIVLCGLLTAFGVAVLSVVIRTPATNNRITEMLQDPRAVVVVAIFGLTLGPLAEELIFRGFLQPLLVRSLGGVLGVFAAAVPFGLLHFQEYGNSWRHALLIALAGAAFGWMRYRTGSTKSSTLMHASYNAMEFIAYFAQQKVTPHT